MRRPRPRPPRGIAVGHRAQTLRAGTTTPGATAVSPDGVPRGRILRGRILRGQILRGWAAGRRRGLLRVRVRRTRVGTRPARGVPPTAGPSVPVSAPPAASVLQRISTDRLRGTARPRGRALRLLRSPGARRGVRSRGLQRRGLQRRERRALERRSPVATMHGFSRARPGSAIRFALPRVHLRRVRDPYAPRLRRERGLPRRRSSGDSRVRARRRPRG